MLRARQLAAASVAVGDQTGWFERLYAEGEAGAAVVPWVLGEPNESLMEWADGLDGDGRLDGSGKRALVVGCGTGRVPALPRWRAEFARDPEPDAAAPASRRRPG
jgi:hypothetical protein